MSNKTKGLLLGIAASTAGIAVWVILCFVEFIAGISAILMGTLFMVVYAKINKEDKSNFSTIVGAVLIFVEIILAEIIFVVLFCVTKAGYSLSSVGHLLKEPGIVKAMAIDIAIGYALGYFAFGSYVYSIKKKAKQDAAFEAQRQSLESQGLPTEIPKEDDNNDTSN